VRIGECMSDEEIFVALARRMKLPVGTESVEEVLNSQLARGGLHMTFAELKDKGSVIVPFKYRKYEDSGFKTPEHGWWFPEEPAFRCQAPYQQLRETRSAPRKGRSVPPLRPTTQHLIPSVKAS
jgi:hypothetical protein